MNAKEVIEKLRIVFNQITNPVALIDATLKDGTPVQVTELVVGGVVTINGQPAPAGEHELSDGTKIVVGDNGVITAIMPMEEEPAIEIEVEGKKEEDMNSRFSSFESMTNEKFASYESKFASYEQRFADYEAKLNKASQVIEGLLNLTQSLAEAPTGVPDSSLKFDEQKPKTKSYDILFS